MKHYKHFKYYTKANEAFNFDNINTSTKHADMINSTKAASRKITLLNTDITKVIKSQLNLDKLKGWKLGKEPVNDYPAYCCARPYDSSFVKTIETFLINSGWIELEGYQVNRYLKGDKKKEDFDPKIKIDEWVKFFDNSNVPAGMADVDKIIISPDEGLYYILYNTKRFKDNYEYLTFTGNKVYDITDDEEDESDEKTKAILLFLKTIKKLYKFLIPVTVSWEYDPDKHQCSANWSWDWAPPRLYATKEILHMINDRIIKGRSCPAWKRIVNDPFHWVFIDPAKIFQCEVSWVAADKKGYLTITHYQNEAIPELNTPKKEPLNRKGKPVVKPLRPYTLYSEIKITLERVLDTFTDEELKEIESTENPFETLLERFNVKWLKG